MTIFTQNEVAVNEVAVNEVAPRPTFPIAFTFAPSIAARFRAPASFTAFSLLLWARVVYRLNRETFYRLLLQHAQAEVAKITN